MRQFVFVLVASTLFHKILTEDNALIIIDVQKCFTEGGTLPVEGGDQVIPVINDVRRSFHLVVLSQDWHCPGHVSFASQYPDYSVYDAVDLEYNSSGHLCRSDVVKLPDAVNCTGETTIVHQTLWPDHCVMNTNDANFHQQLTVDDTDIIIKKGFHCHLDSYSAFYDNGRYSETALRQTLDDFGVTHVYLTGLATDYCVYWSAKDAKELGFQTYVILDATRGIDPDSTAEAIVDMKAKGILIINSTDVEDILMASAPETSFAISCYAIILLITSVQLLY